MRFFFFIIIMCVLFVYLEQLFPSVDIIWKSILSAKPNNT